MYAIGVDIGGTKIAAGVVDDDGRILAQVRRQTVFDDPASIDEAVASCFAELALDFDIDAVGIAAAGFISSDRNTVPFASNIAWRDYALGDRVAELIGRDDVRVVVENDANAAGWAEFRFGAARHVDDMITLTVGTGLGGAIVLGGQLWRGTWGMAAEIGHMNMIPDGHLCGCGQRGCWEQYASGRALVREAKRLIRANPDQLTLMSDMTAGNISKLIGPQVTSAAQQGDELAVEAFRSVGHWLGQGAADLVALLDPAVFVLGGGVALAGDLLLVPTREAFVEKLSGRGHRNEAEIVLAEYGNDAGIVGAAALARV